MNRYRYRIPCAECGSMKVRCELTGATDDDRPLRQRRCTDCGYRFTTVEVVVPGATIYQLDVFRRWRNRMRMRELRGYHGTRAGSYERRPRRLRVSVTVDREGAA